MSLPNLPNIDPQISLTTEEVSNLLLASIAMKGLGISHLVNAEAEKIQYVLGMLHIDYHSSSSCLEDLLTINSSIQKTLNSVIQNELLLQMQMNTILNSICCSAHDGDEDYMNDCDPSSAE